MNFSKTTFGTIQQSNPSESRDDKSVGIAMLESAGADYTVEKRQLSYARDLTATTGDGQTYTTGSEQVLIDAYNPVRTDTGASLSNKTVGKNYTVLQNREMVAIVDEICKQRDLSYNYMTSLNKGAGLCLQVTSEDLNRALSVGGEDHKGYLTLSNWHDGSGSFVSHISMIRLICANVMPAMKSEIRQNAKRGDESIYRIRHGKSLEDNVITMIDELHLAMGDLEATAYTLNTLAQVDISQAAIDELFKSVVAATSKSIEAERDEEKRIKETDRQAAVVNDLQERMKQRANTPIGMEGTYYHALQAITDFGTRGRKIGKGKNASQGERQFVDRTMGKGAAFSFAGLGIAMEMAGV